MRQPTPHNKQVPIQLKKPRPLTYKQKAFIKHIIDNPKSSATEAAKSVYAVKSAHTAEQIAYENLRKPEIVSKLSYHNQLIEDTLINTVNDWKTEENSRKREIAVDTAKYIHDKIHGRAKQQVDVNTTGTTLIIDLTSSLTDTQELTDTHH